MSEAPTTPSPAVPEEPLRSVPELRRYKLTIAYDGTLFHGWQKQEPAGVEPLRTVQGVVEQAVLRTMQQQLNVVGASRTDAGVHALGQTAQFDAATRIPLERMADAINSRLPEDVEVRRAEFAPPGFDAISGARSKQYRYRLFMSKLRPLDRRHYVYHCWTPLDVGRMNDAARRMIGEHDFLGFAAASHDRITTVRTIHDCRVEAVGDEVQVVVSGSGFLYNMVRIITGTLVEVGRGRFGPEVVDLVLRTRERREAGPTMPPTGLWLEWVKYE
ncbi:MAG: tRNA pseudouridine(38-40) synthase TruA [Planctomycetes bacterium]|nr:tRNA pseudouridine(38-40) synthase TruA [Planctomycetota bacterium]